MRILWPALLVAGFSAALPACRWDSRAAEPAVVVPLEGLDLVEARAVGIGTFLLPRGWHLDYGQYPSQIGDQNYEMVRVSYDRDDEDNGLLSIDVSPSHPRLFRRPLSEFVEERLAALRVAGDVTVRPWDHAMGDLPYEAEQRFVRAGRDLWTIFRVFRQSSRVITVAFTATSAHFVPSQAHELVHRVSESIVVELPVVTHGPPDLRTEHRTLVETVSADVPASFELASHRWDIELVPVEILELSLPGRMHEEDRPRLTLSVLRLSMLGPGVQVEGLAVPPGGEEVATGGGERAATVLQVDDDTLAAMRVVRIGGDVLTVTYAAPDYAFDVKSALRLLETVAQSARIHPLPE